MNNPILTKKVSLGSFSFVKGIAISAIILGHIALEFDMTQLTWFHPLFILVGFFKTSLIPLFFIISGYTYKNTNPITQGIVNAKPANDLRPSIVKERFINLHLPLIPNN